MEIFKDINNYEGRYKISNMGNVLSLLSGKILKQSVGNHGYNVVNLTGESSKQKVHCIHILVAQSFLDHESNGFKLVVDHIDRNKRNNKLINLRVVSNRENTSYNKGKSKYIGVTIDRGYIYSRIQIDGKTVHLGSFKTEEEAHERYKQELEKI